MARRASAREFREGTLLWKPLEERKVGANVSRYLPALAERHQGPGLRLLRGLVAVVGERLGSFLESRPTDRIRRCSPNVACRVLAGSSTLNSTTPSTSCIGAMSPPRYWPGLKQGRVTTLTYADLYRQVAKEAAVHQCLKRRPNCYG